MKIAFNPSTVAALITPPNNKDITFDLRGRNIFARGVKFCGTDTWRDIKINNVSIGSNILDLRNGSNTTLTNTNGVVTINSTWRPVVDNLTSDSTTSSLSANQGRILKALIDGKSNSGHTHDDRYLKLTGGTMTGNIILSRNATITKLLASTSHYSSVVSWSVDGETKKYGREIGLHNLGGSDSTGSIAIVPYKTDTEPWSGTVGLFIAKNTLKLDGKPIAFKSDIPSSLKNPYSLTLLANGITLATYDGSVSKIVNLTYDNVGAAAKNHTHNSLEPWASYITGDSHATALKSIFDKNKTSIPRNKFISMYSSAYDNGSYYMGYFLLGYENNPYGGFFVAHYDTAYYIEIYNGSFTQHRLAYSTDIPNSLKNPHALTISLNGTSQGPYDGSAAKNINITPGSIGAATNDHNHDNRYLKLTGGTMQLGEGLKFHADDNYFGTNSDARIISLLDGNDKVCDGGLIIDERATYKGTEYVTELLRIRDSEFKWRGADILHSGNYSDILDTRYYTESEVNNLLSNKLNTSDFNWTNLPGKLAGNEFNIVNAGFNNRMWFNFLPINDRSKTATISYYCFGNGNGGYASVTASGFVKNGSSSSYVLLGDGGHKTISSLSVNYANSAGNANTLDGIDSTRFLRQVVVPNNTENDFNTFSNMTLTGRVDPTTGASLKNAPWSGSGPAGGYGVLTYLFDGGGYGTQMAWEYGTNRIYIRNRHYSGHPEVGSIWRTSWDKLALTSDNVASATKLQTPRTIWGQSFDGTTDVSGDMTDVGIINTILNLKSKSGKASLYLETVKASTDYAHLFVTNKNDKNNVSRPLILQNGYGNVGIGTNSPAYKLHVAGDIYSTTGFKKNGSSDSYVLLGGGGHKLESALSVANADTVDGYHASSLVKFYLSPMTSNAPADSAKSWFVDTMPSASGAIVYNVPGAEKTIIAGKSSGAYGHMLQLNYDDTYLRILRYYGGSWKSTDWEKISAGYADSAGSVSWNNITGKPSSFTPSAHTHSWTSITDKLVAGNEFNIVNAGFNEGMWFNYLPINDRSKTATITGYHFGNGATGYTSINASGFIKKGSSSSYVLLGDGGHQTISSLSVNYANSAGNADTVDGYHATSGSDKPWGTIPAITTSGWMDIGKHLEFHFDNTTGSDYSTILRCTGNYSNIVNLPSAAGTLALTSDIPTSLPANGGNADTTDGVHITWAGELTSTNHLVAWETDGSALRDINPANISVGYASSAGNADKLDGYHASELLTALSNSNNGISITVGGTTKSVSNISVNYANSAGNADTALYLRSLGNLNCQTGRTLNYGDVYTYNTYDGNTGSPTTFTSVIGFGRGIAGTVEIAGGWDNTNLYWRSLRDCCEDWHSWRTVLDSSNYTEYINNYYWANVKISTSSSTTTSPTVSNLTATSSIRMGNIYLLNTDEINNSTNGSIYLNYRNSGNVSLCYGGGSVGIGTTSPTYKLDVNGDIHSSGTINCNALNVSSTLNVKDSVISCSAGNISILSKESGSLLINSREVLHYDSDFIYMNNRIDLLHGLCFRTSTLDTTYSIYTTDDVTVLIGVLRDNASFKFRPAKDGLLLFLKIGKLYSNTYFWCTAENCVVVRAKDFGIYLDKDQNKDCFGDGLARIFIYTEASNRWYEFYCG